MQFAFLAFLVGQSLEGFGQWKALLHLLLGCQAAPLQKRPKLFARLLTALRVRSLKYFFCIHNQPLATDLQTRYCFRSLAHRFNGKVSAKACWILREPPATNLQRILLCQYLSHHGLNTQRIAASHAATRIRSCRVELCREVPKPCTSRP